jgi:hypothetical protein
MKESELALCKVMETDQYVCKRQRTLFSTATVESCAVMMFQKREILPSKCDRRLVQLSHTVWIQLRNNTWIYFAPNPDIITVVCNDRNPMDVSLKEVGQLQVYQGCKGYGTTAILYSNSNAGNISRQIRGDLIYQIPLSCDCGEESGVQINFSKLTADLRYKTVVSHLEDMKHASKRVDELLEEVGDQEWRNTHVVYRHAHSVLLLFVGSVVLVCLMYKAFPYVRRWYSCRICKKQTPTPPAEEVRVVELSRRGSATEVNVASSDGVSNAEDATPQSPERAPRLRTNMSHF